MDSILLVSSSTGEVKQLQSELRREGFTVFVAGNGKQAVQEAGSRSPDLVVWDFSSSPSPAESLEEIQARGLPILGLAPEADIQKVAGLRLADFALQPLRPGEALARVKALLARSHGGEGTDVLQSGDLTVDLSHYTVTVAGRLVDLAFMEFKLLQFLMQHPGRVFSREALLDQVWGYDYYGGSRTVDVHIRRLRSKLEDATHTFIETVRNVGYRFQA